MYLIRRDGRKQNMPCLSYIWSVRNFFARYQVSRMAEPVTASLLVFDKAISIGFRDEAGQPHTVHLPMQELTAAYEISSGESVIRHSITGHELRVQGKEATTIILDMQEELNKPWYKKKNAGFRGRVALFMTGFLLVLVVLYFLFVPYLSAKIAESIAPETEQQLGDAVYEAMNLKSAEDTSSSRLLNEFFAAMEIETPYRIRIAVINSTTANAFAVPGGQLVVYSALLDKIRSYPELAALLSHEYTHVVKQHATKAIFRKLGSKIFLGLLFGRMGNVTSVLIDHADDVKSLTYSRTLEKEADTEGLALLMERRIDPEGFTALFRHLKESAPESALPEFLLSHPDIENRIAYIKELSKQAAVEEQPRLSAIFNQLKR